MSLIDKYKLEKMGKNTWRVKEELTFVARRTTVIPKGFVTDLASIPRPFQWLFGDKEEACIPSCLVHDYYYSTGKGTRKEADDEFLQLMNVYKNPKFQWQRDLCYWAVVMFGGSGWGKSTQKK